MSMRNKIVAATPLLATIAFLTIGFTTGIWHPTWAVFFSVLIVPEILDKNFYLKIYPIIVIATYVTLGITLGIWHPLWIIFLTIPVYYIIFGSTLKCHKHSHKRIEKDDDDDDSVRVEVL